MLHLGSVWSGELEIVDPIGEWHLRIEAGTGT
jgi:hypothetical protein